MFALPDVDLLTRFTEHLRQERGASLVVRPLFWTVANNTPDTHILCDRAGIHTALPLHFFLERYAESYLLEMRAFIDAVVNQKPVPVGGEDGFKAVVIALAAGISARENRPVKLSEIHQGVASACRA